MSQPSGPAPSWSAREDFEPEVRVRKRNHRIPIVAAVFLVAIIATIAVYFLDRHSSPPGLPDVGLQYAGTVRSISDSSITITFGQKDPSQVTASITSTTKYFGQHKGVDQIKEGDHVAMAVVSQGGKAVVFGIEDPATMIPQKS